jgi:hypothetical protein
VCRLAAGICIDRAMAHAGWLCAGVVGFSPSSSSAKRMAPNQAPWWVEVTGTEADHQEEGTSAILDSVEGWLRPKEGRRK